MVVRHGQAVHIRQGEPAEEAPVNEVDTDGDPHLFRCDLPLMDEAAAADALATLSDATVLGQSVLVGEAPSWVEHHQCDHDENNRSGCTVVGREEGPG